MINSPIAFIAQFAACFFMTGVILVIQLTHYPSFKQIEKSEFLRFHYRHSAALGLIAAPAMIIELISALWLAYYSNIYLIANAGFVVSLWLITFLVSVPCHNRLSTGFDIDAWQRLVRTNWIRTFIWCARSVCLIIWALKLT